MIKMGQETKRAEGEAKQRGAMIISLIRKFRAVDFDFAMSRKIFQKKLKDWAF
jgi:hypothetical protein